MFSDKNNDKLNAMKKDYQTESKNERPVLRVLPIPRVVESQSKNATDQRQEPTYITSITGPASKRKKQ